MPAERRDWRAFSSCFIVVEECPNGVDAVLVEIGNGSMDIAHGVQNDGSEMVSSPFIVRRERKSTKPSKIQRGALLALPAITDISFGAIVPLNVLSPRSSYPPARFGNRWQSTLVLPLRNEYDGDKDLPRQGLSRVPLGDSFADAGATFR